MCHRTKEATDLAPVHLVSKELLDQLVIGSMTSDKFETMFRGLKEVVLERALSAKLTDPLAAEEAPTIRGGNHRNGTTPKAVITDEGTAQF